MPMWGLNGILNSDFPSNLKNKERPVSKQNLYLIIYP